MICSNILHDISFTWPGAASWLRPKSLSPVNTRADAPGLSRMRALSESPP